MFSTAELSISDLSVGRWGISVWYQREEEKPVLKSRNAVNYETTTIVGEDVVTDTDSTCHLAILVLIIRGNFKLISQI